jgi:alkanesulfonate monooxygenase SsuD/methylene tetrahydromethanopterin reductase-like flavin-dependent oxidoreductase (luciferase family)
VPILFGASTAAGLRRAGRLGNGFVGFAHATRLDTGGIEGEIGAIRLEAAEHGREEAISRITYRVAGRADEVAAAMPALRRAGVTEIVVTVSWSDPDGPQRTCEALRAAATGLEQEA